MHVKNITDCLEKEQIDKVLSAAQQCSQRDYLMLRVLGAPGCGSMSCSRHVKRHRTTE